MKISTKKLLLAGILAGSLISYPNITFAADEDEEDISDVEISEDEEDIDTDIDEEESETTTTATETTTTPVSSSTTSTGDELDNKLAYNTIEVGENEVEFNGVRVKQGVGQGEYTFTADSSSGNGNVAWNKITINGGRFNLIINGGSYTGSLIGNEFILNGGRLSLNVNNELSFGGSVRDNVLKINGGDFANSYLTLPNVTATNNTVEISGSPNLSNVYLYGGILGDVDNASGNTLNVNAVGITARNIYDFDNLNFNLPSSTKNGDTALTLTEGSTDISNRTVNAVVAGGTGLTTGDKITLLANGNGLDTSGVSMNSRFAEGVTLTYDTELTPTSNGIELTLGAARVEEQTRALNQGAVVSSGEISNATSQIMDSLKVEDFDPTDEESKANSNLMMISNAWGIFADMNGGKLKTKTGNGSYVKSKSRGMNLGLARVLSDPDSAPFVIAPVIDYGKTNYDSYLADGTHGHGNSKYFLGGLLVRKMNKNGFYWEGSFRGGKADTSFSSNDFFRGSRRSSVGFDDSTPAFAGHVRVGQLKRLNKNNLMHVYGIYSHSHINSMNTTISTGENYNFDSVDNGTFKLGYRLTTRTSPISNIYTGLAFQYQFNGATAATYRGYTTPKAEIKGATGILELGWQIRPQKSHPWALDINFTGQIGLQKGIYASAGVKKAF
ncbi:MAG: autotransporter outer membrane beta-barrel domain-containing protein [Selenomonadaceae bacterium]|nr:autotransporter outer membrane beta-barrel domain-containing protein [Selenomonadaceae bacterium]